MKKVIFILISLFAFFSTNAQEIAKKSRKEIKTEKQLLKKEKVENLLSNKTFVFNATHALPMGGSSVNLNYSYNVEIENDTIVSYLPFYGVAHYVEYGGRNSGFDFTKPIKNYAFEKNDDGYLIEFEVSNKNDYFKFNFHISDLGFASLNVTSTNRQSISFYGTIDEIEEVD